MKATRKFILFFFVALCVIVGSYIFIISLNNAFAKNVLKEIKSIQLPENTIIIAQKAAAGNFESTGDHMEYIGLIVVKSEDKAELVQSCRNFCIDEVEGANITVYGRMSCYFSELERVSDFSDYYIIYKLESAKCPVLFLDIRAC